MNLSKIHHIAIIVSEYEAAKDFYVTDSSYDQLSLPNWNRYP